MNPTTFDTAYLGGIESITCMWPGMRDLPRTSTPSALRACKGHLPDADAVLNTECVGGTLACKQSDIIGPRWCGLRLDTRASIDVPSCAWSLTVGNPPMYAGYVKLPLRPRQSRQLPLTLASLAPKKTMMGTRRHHGPASGRQIKERPGDHRPPGSYFPTGCYQPIPIWTPGPQPRRKPHAGPNAP